MYRCSIDVPRVTKPAGRSQMNNDYAKGVLGRYDDERCGGALRWRTADVHFEARGAPARAHRSPRVIAVRQK